MGSRTRKTQPAPAEVWDRQNWSKVVAAWGETPGPDEIAQKALWRNERLAALAAHLKQQQPWKK